MKFFGEKALKAFLDRMDERYGRKTEIDRLVKELQEKNAEIAALYDTVSDIKAYIGYTDKDIV